MKKLLYICIPIFFLFACKTTKTSPKQEMINAGVQYDDSTLYNSKAPYLLPYNRVINSAGISLRYGNPNLENHSLDLCVFSDSIVFVMDRYGVAAINPITSNLIHRLTYDSLPNIKSCMSVYSGIRSYSEHNKELLCWPVADKESNKSYLLFAEWNGHEIKFKDAITFETLAPATNALPNEIIIEKENDISYLYVVLNGNNQLIKIDLATKNKVWTVETGVAPYALTLLDGKIFVTNWAGSRVDENTADSLFAGIPWDKAYVDPKTGAINNGTVSVFNAFTGSLIKEIQVGLHPNAIISNPEKNKIFVSNGNSDFVSIINPKSMISVDSIYVGLFEKTKFNLGSTPNALAFNEDGSRLYVANGMDNALAVVNMKSNQPFVMGYIPTEAYPSGIVVLKNHLVVTNLESIGARAIHKNSKDTFVQIFNAHRQLASVSIIDIPSAKQLKKYTQKVMEQSRYERALISEIAPRKNVPARPVPERIGEPSVFKHVLYIIKENRTYDQVLGDMPEGRGMANLCVFGDSVTPNQHKIAKDYVLLDNYHVSGKSSAEGHHWANAGIVTDYTEKSVRAWFRSYPHVLYDAMVYFKNGFIWSNALAHGKTVKIYGEACSCEYDRSKYNWSVLYSMRENGTISDFNYKNTTTIHPLRPYLALDFPGCDDATVSDQMRADAFINELNIIENNPKSTLPNLMIMALPNDHTAGTDPRFPTVRAMVADNDLAVGRIVESLMNSRFADSTVIFISEDDSQSGWDHISAYRTTGFVISKYSLLGKTIPTNYNQTSLLRTVEQILGLPPTNIIDATATPMFDCFSMNKNETYTFKYLKNRIPLDEMNKPLLGQSGQSLKLAKLSMDFAFHKIDQGDDELFNQIIWFAAKGNVPYPEFEK